MIINESPNCSRCIYKEECAWLGEPNPSPYSCGVFGDWAECTRCAGVGFIEVKGKFSPCVCSEGWVKGVKN